MMFRPEPNMQPDNGGAYDPTKTARLSARDIANARAGSSPEKQEKPVDIKKCLEDGAETLKKLEVALKSKQEELGQTQETEGEKLARILKEDIKVKGLVVHAHYLYSEVLRELLKRRAKRPNLQLVGNKAQDIAHINNEQIMRASSILVENEVEKARILQEEEIAENGGRPGLLKENGFYDNFLQVRKYVVDMRPGVPLKDQVVY